MLIFSEETAICIYNLYHSSTPIWKSSWHPSLSKTRTVLSHIVNIMGADAMATKGPRASTTMIFTVLNWNNSVLFFSPTSRVNGTLLLCDTPWPVAWIRFLHYWSFEIGIQGSLAVSILRKGLDFKAKSTLKLKLISKDSLTWLLTGRRLCCQPIRWQG